MSPDPLHHLLDALADLRRFWERPDRKRRFLAELGVPIELGALRALTAVARFDATDDDPDPGVGSVAEACAVEASTASRLVEQAVRAGYLERRPGHGDRRRTRLELTDAGTKLLERATEIRRRWLAQITATWSEDEVQLLADLLHRFIDDATTAEEPPA